MVTMAIRRMRVRYHLRDADPDGREEVRRRLDGVVARALGSTLNAAMERSGLPSSEEICIRSLAVPVRLRLGGSDPDLAAEWSMAVSSSLINAIERGGDEVVRYRSSTHAVLDMAAGVAKGDTRRAWAWQQLGQWDDTANGQAQVEIVVRALLRTPQSIVPVLAELGRSGALKEIGPRFAEQQWRRLGMAALAAVEAPSEPATLTRSVRQAVVSADLSLRAERVVRRSSLAAVLMEVVHRAGFGRKPATVAAVAALVALDADPGTVRSRQSGPWFRAAIERILLRSAARAAEDEELGPAFVAQGERPALRASRQELPGGAPSITAGTSQPESRRPVTIEAGPDVTSDLATDPTLSDGDAPSLEPALPAYKAAIPYPPTAPEPITDDRGRKSQPPAERDVTVADAVEMAEGFGFHRSSGRTRYGGLLFLLHVCRRIDLIDRLDEPLGDRPVRWVMHQLAMGLLPLADDDPAALAFAGLAPDAEPPSATEPATSPAERDALADLAARVVSALVELLERPGEPVASLLRSVCRRTALVVADPGWIDVQLHLDERTIEVRRAGLDLDPGYVPWLGVALRFLYD